MSRVPQRGRRRKHGWVRSHEVYAPPGTLAPSPGSSSPDVRMIAYGPGAFLDHRAPELSEIASLRGRHPVVWVNVDGLGDAGTVGSLGAMFGLHRLALEDLITPNQRPKVDTYEGYLVIIARMVDRAGGRLGSEQLSLVLGRNYVLTFQERSGDCLDAIRARLKERRGRIRDAGPDYLAYAIVDAVIDEYFPVLEELGDRLEDLEDDALICPQPDTARRIHRIKRDLLVLRRAMWPLREALGVLQRDTTRLITPATQVYLRDGYDHCVQAIDLIEVYRELANGLMDVYMSAINFRMNDIVRVLTIISTVFIPLTFVSGIYGMNFEHMPELAWPWGYPLILTGMGAIGGGMLFFFRRKGWLGRATTFDLADPDTAPGRPSEDRSRGASEPTSGAGSIPDRSESPR